MRQVLLVAYHFPPIIEGSGLQRTLRFAQYLPEFGWQPTVLTVRSSVYESADNQSLALIPPECNVVRTPCIDTWRYLSLLNKVPRLLALPDRWSSWRIWAVAAGIRLVQERRIEAIWSTYPIATAHRVGYLIASRSRIPWIADFRDPMAQDDYPQDPGRWKAFKRIEEAAVSQAAKLVFVSPAAMQLYQDRYPTTSRGKFVLLQNGFDESSFGGLDLPAEGQFLQEQSEPRRSVPVMLHSGIVYPSERDPQPLFEALSRLNAEGRILPGDFIIRFRASVHEALLADLAARYGVGAFVELRPPLPYGEALREMVEADALLVMQGKSCNGQIPAKLYEYLRAGRPILGLTDPAGDTGKTLIALGCSLVTRLESVDAIQLTLPRFLEGLRNGTLTIPKRSMIDRYSRRTLTKRLAGLLDEVTSDKSSRLDRSTGQNSI